ncbi:unnamed protein product [Didymodactylos carnosus]|uniref:Uncharacterized protein n=1 Tax=Didymodactylos carnosus TaxID=1234261 RepID=A0A814HFZ9_9BILA|nr:unnamed protein product [Didymodactylos carnosus]CAF3780365.1 unnamed protein product [Didymodactylos carnosus]
MAFENNKTIVDVFDQPPIIHELPLISSTAPTPTTITTVSQHFEATDTAITTSFESKVIEPQMKPVTDTEEKPQSNCSAKSDQNTPVEAPKTLTLPDTTLTTASNSTMSMQSQLHNQNTNEEKISKIIKVLVSAIRQFDTPKPTNTNKKEIISTVTTKKNDFPLIKTVKNVSDRISEKVEEIHQNLHDPVLDLDKIPLTNEELKSITNTLLYNTTRIKVNLTQIQLKGDGISLITELLTANQTITELNLSRNNIEDNGSIEISNILKFSKYLKILNIGSNQISQQGILKIADTLTTNKILNSLNIESNPIDNFGIKYICHALSSNQHLTTLNIYGKLK